MSLTHYFEHLRQPVEFLCGATGGIGVWANEILAGVSRVHGGSCRACVMRLPGLLRSPEPSAVDQLAQLAKDMP